MTWEIIDFKAEMDVKPLEQQPPSLLDLPPEIRDQIYKEYFSIPKPKHECSDGSTKYSFDLSLLRASKQIHREALQIFRLQELFVRIETPWPQAQGYVIKDGRVPLVASGEEADNFAYCHLRATISSPDMETSTESRFIIFVDDLEAFCRIWFYSNLTFLEMNRHLCLTLTLNHPNRPGTPLPKHIQKRLTEPFGLIKELHKFEMIGDIDGDTQAAVRRAQNTPLDSPATCLEKSLALHEAGETQTKAGKYREAIDTFSRAFHAIHIVIDGRNRWIHADRFFEAILPTPIFNSDNAGYVRVMMRIKLVASTILALLKLEEWEEAHFWGMRSIMLFRRSLGEGADEPGHPSFPAPREWGKVYGRTAMAAEEMGNYREARDLYRVAAKWLPGDDSVVSALRRIGMRLG